MVPAMTPDELADVALGLTAEVVLGAVGVERMTRLPPPLARPENDAEHSFGLAVLACALVDALDPTLDRGRVAELALAHDLVEVYAGDSPFGDPAAEATQGAREEAALERYRTAWAHLPWLAETIAAFERQDTAEAVYVRSLDKLVPLLVRLHPAGCGWRADGLDRPAVQRRVERLRPLIAHPAVARLHAALLARAFADDRLFADPA